LDIIRVIFFFKEGPVSNTTKHDLIVDVSKSTGLTQADTKIAVEEFLESINRILETGKNIEIRGFGTFYTKIRKPRPARNPKTGEVVPLLKRVVPLFKYSSELKETITTSLMQKKAALPPSPA
jgi:DNA-binding protein HU-beta/integration host factor subunit beta